MTHQTVRPLMALVAVLLAAALAACGTIPQSASGNQAPPSSRPGSAASGPPTSTTTAPTAEPTPEPEPVVLTPNVKDGSTKVTVDTTVSVRATAGTLGPVALKYRLKDRDGKTVKGTVPGTLSKDRTSWQATELLEPAAAYTLAMVGKNASDGSTIKATSGFTTENLTLAEQTFAQLQPLKGSTVGVGMPVVLTFDVPVRNRKAFEQKLTVTSSPDQAGSWRWFSDREVHFRPKRYWKPGTRVKVTANLNGVNAGGGIYGQNTTSTSFGVGRSVVTKINLNSKTAKVYVNGDLERTIPISGGKAGWQTRSGTKLILDKLYTTRMTNEMIGAEEDYDLKVRYAMRVTMSGEFLHAAPWNSGYFGQTNASHGCVGMSTANAGWLFGKVKIGDPVVTTGSSRGLEVGNGWTDWDMSFAEYKKGSAL